MTETTKKSVLFDIELENSARKMTSDDSRIESIADKYPNEYSCEQEYVEFQIEIAKLI
ncbi:MAG: hypothetical protein ACTSYW_00495 [Candidatus Heimdallarchaeota archaeon]